MLGLQHQRFDVAVVEFLLLVRQRLELFEHARELDVVELEAQFLDALAQRMAAAVFAQHQRGARQAHVLRTHDFVGRVMLEHAVLVDARFVREGVLADDRLVARNRHADDVRQHARGRIEARGVDAGVEIEERIARLQRHDDFFERAVAGALADAVDGALDLARAGDHRGEAVGDRHAEIVVAMHRQADLVDAAHVLAQVAEQLREFIRHRVAHRVRECSPWSRRPR